VREGYSTGTKMRLRIFLSTACDVEKQRARLSEQGIATPIRSSRPKRPSGPTSSALGRSGLGEQAEAVAADIRASGGEAIAATIDVTSEPAWIALIEKTVARYGRLDILVNNAGISGSSVGDPDGLEGWQRVIAVYAR